MVVSLQGGSNTLTTFLNPSRAVAKTVMQTVGELDFETIFNDGNLLFFTFVVVMPVLFSKPTGVFTEYYASCCICLDR